MTASLVVCQFNVKPHALDDECQNVTQIPQWIVDEGRLDCEHAGYSYPRVPGIGVCRCLICSRCKKHTGNNNQGHFWSFCQVTKTTLIPHQCCPGDCELDSGHRAAQKISVALGYLRDQPIHWRDGQLIVRMPERYWQALLRMKLDKEDIKFCPVDKLAQKVFGVDVELVESAFEVVVRLDRP